MYLSDFGMNRVICMNLCFSFFQVSQNFFSTYLCGYVHFICYKWLEFDGSCTKVLESSKELLEKVCSLIKYLQLNVIYARYEFHWSFNFLFSLLSSLWNIVGFCFSVKLALFWYAKEQWYNFRININIVDTKINEMNFYFLFRNKF